MTTVRRNADRVSELEKLLEEKRLKIEELEKLTEAYEQVSDSMREQLVTADSALQAQERLQELIRKERREADRTILAHENLRELEEREKQAQQDMLSAQERVTGLTMQELMDRDRALRDILEVNRGLSSILDSKLLLKTILERLLHSLRAERGVLFLSGKTGLEAKVFQGLKKDDIGKPPFRPSMELASSAESTRKSQLVKNRQLKNGKKEFTLSAIAVPMIHQDELLGVLYADTVSGDRFFRENELQLAEIFSSQAAVSLENARMYRELEELNKSLERKVQARTRELSEANDNLRAKEAIIKSDLALASRVQSNLLPRASSLQGFPAAVRYLPLNEVGGDIYDIATLRDGRLRLFLADATGHGVPAALVTMLIQGEYNKLRSVVDDPGELLSALNSNFLENYYRLGLFFTCVLADIDPAKHEVRYASAGHPEQYLHSGGKWKALKPTGKMVGVMEGIVIGAQTLKTGPASRLLLLTDGMTEEFSPGGEEWGEERFMENLARYSDRSTPPADLLSSLLADLDAWMDGVERNDDITMIALDLP